MSDLYYYNFLLSPAAVLISAGVGYWASNRTIKLTRMHEQEQKEKKKKMILELLRDEIKLRWRGEIYAALNSLHDSKIYKDPERALKVFARSRLSDSDLFIIKDISMNLQGYSFIGEPSFISKVIHSYVLIKDLLDFQTTLKKFFSDYEAKFKALDERDSAWDSLDAQYKSKLEEFWTQFGEKFKNIDDRFSLIDTLVEDSLK